MSQNKAVTDLATPTWWDTVVAHADTPIRELVAGLDEVAAVAIPYARLPRRVHKAYSADFSRWSDIAEQSVESLLAREGVAEVGVRALLEAATDAVAAHRPAAGRRVGAVAAVARLLDQLGELDRAILSARVWAAQPQSTYALAERLGVHSVRIQRNQPRAEARLAELLADPVHHEVGEYADMLRGRLGPYVPTGVVAAELGRLEVDPSTETARRYCCGSQAPMCRAATGLRTRKRLDSTKSRPPPSTRCSRGVRRRLPPHSSRL